MTISPGALATAEDILAALNSNASVSNAAKAAADAAAAAAVAAQTTANAAMPKAGGTMTGNFDAPIQPPSMIARNLTVKFSDGATIKDFGAKGDGVADDTTAIQAAFTWATTTGNPINPTSGMFLISSPLVLLPNLAVDGTFKRPGPEINLGQRAYFKATAAMGTMLTIGSTAADFSGLVVEWALKLGEWDCNDLANEGIAVAFANGCRIRDTRVRNHKVYGFHLGSQSSPTPSFQIYLEDCGTDRSLTNPAPTGSTAAFYDNASDMAVLNCVFIGNQIGLSANASGGSDSGIWDAKIINVHVWNYPESGELLYGIDVWGDNHIIGCQVDGPFQYGYRFRGFGNVITNSEVNYGGIGSLASHAYPILIDAGATVTAIGNRWKCTNQSTPLVAEATGDLHSFSSMENIVTNTSKFGPRSANSVNTWALISAGASPTVQDGSNISGAVRSSVGDYTVTTNNSIDTAGCVSVTPGNGGVFMAPVEVSNSRTVNSIRVQFYDLSGSLVDPNTFSIMFVGRPTGIY